MTGPDARVRCGTAESSQRPLCKFYRFTPYPDALAGLPLACVSQISKHTRGAARRPAPFVSHGVAAWDHCLTQPPRFTQRPSPLVHGTDGSFLVTLALHVLLVASTTGVMPLASISDAGDGGGPQTSLISHSSSPRWRRHKV